MTNVVSWADAPGFEGLYEVSSNGAVRSKRRRGAPGGVLKAGTNRKGYAYVRLRNSHAQKHFLVHRLVLLAFSGPDDGLLCRHLDGDPQNNDISNLTWGTRSENALDAVRHGTHRNPGSEKTHCVRGHEFTETNTYRTPSTSRPSIRTCRTCRREAKRRYRQKKLAEYDAVKAAKPAEAAVTHA